MIFRHRKETQEVDCDSTITKLEDLTGKLPVLEIENEAFIKKKKEVETMNYIVDVFRSYSGYEMYGEALEAVLKIMESDYGIFGYINRRGDFVCPSMTKNVWDKCLMEDKDTVFPVGTWGNSLWGRAITEKKTFYSNKAFNTPEGHITIQRAMMVPIIYNDKVIGLFEVANKETDYTKYDQYTLEQIARLISPILMARLQRDGILQKGKERNAA